MEVLVGKGHIDDQFGFEFFHQGGQFGDVVGIHLGRFPLGFFQAALFQGLDDGIAFGLGPGGNHYL